ncbi:protein preY, mitochondrial [Pteropus vampyrus]|uniref:Protein preY, mitochondrial n=1 Tax=Pteropus vampyrus TaxID=132908 RepID=A0A6P3PY84_PTEVA|nr:protein preY, mitochondrial [Pteropus vampyrus]
MKTQGTPTEALVLFVICKRGVTATRGLLQQAALIITELCCGKSSRVRSALGTKAPVPPVGGCISRAPRGGTRGDRLERPGWRSTRRGAVAGYQTMLSGACGKLASALRRTRAPASAVARRCLRASGSRLSADKSERTGEPHRTFDLSLLEFLVCPLSKKPLRYEASTNELINEELGIAYPIIDGIPNMIPQAARMTRQNKKQEDNGAALDHD